MNGITLRNILVPVISTFAAASLLLSGCGQTSPKIPVNRIELQDYFAQTPDKYGIEQINQFNLSRVLSNDLAPADRLNSLAVLLQLNGCTPKVMSELSLTIDNPGTPASVRTAIVGVLARNDQEGIQKYVLQELQTDGDPRLRNSLVDWITRHPSADMLDEVVVLWAESDPANIQAENRFCRAVETISLRTWSDAMLEAINSDDFSAKTSALKMLYRRMDTDKLIARIKQLKPQSRAMQALHYYATEMNTLPKPEGFFQSVVAYVSKRDSLTEISATVKTWAERDGYDFSPSDIHLLKYASSRWGSNIFARDAITTTLVDNLSRRLNATDIARLQTALPKLDTADIYRLSLLSELFADPETSSRIRIVAQRDKDDRSSRWGGLVAGYDSGVGATLYPPAKSVSDYEYHASERFLHDAADCICWFVCHFEPNGKSQGRPEGGELALSQQLDLPGIVISQIGEDHYSVVLFDSPGLVVPLGVYQFAM